MPELPEVETISRSLDRSLKNLKIVNVWTDWPKYFSAYGGSASSGKLSGSEKEFKKCAVGRTITGARRRAKYVLIDLSDNYLLAIHQKMTGHLLYGKWQIANRKSNTPANWEKEKWLPEPFEGPLTDPMNRFVRLIFFLSNGRMLAFSDARRFGKILCGSPKEVLRHLEKLGPEPLDPDFTFEKFKDLFTKRRGRIKQVLMNPEFIAGIGNIYADEILYAAKVHPLSRVEKLNPKTLQVIYSAILSILKKAIELQGTSIDDYRIPDGRKGQYGKVLLVYQRTGQKCPHGHTIKRIVIGARSAHFCPVEQRLYK